MTKPSTLRTPLFAFLAAAALAAPAAAQQASQDAMLQARPYAVTADQAQQIVAERLMQASLASDLKDLHARLDLDPAQERRWRAFIDASFAPLQAPSALLTLAADAGPLERAEAKSEAFHDAWRRQRRAVGAMKALYGSLSAEQRRVLDAGLDSLSSTVIVPVG